MADSAVEILHSIGGNYNLFSYRQDGLGIHKYTVNFDDQTGDIKAFTRDYNVIRLFTADWLKNIKEQQGFKK
ncbi:MAG: hypothetical protein IPL22_21445 [Bacteroidetes bacterium]|nr:hypothetical protein [Bacteroidota bacterium]